MMSPKRWTLLLIFYISYLMFGASIYYHIEHNLETQLRAEQLQERIEMYDYLTDQLADKSNTTQNEILEKITDYCGKPVTDYNKDEFEPPYTWTFYHAFFFAFTVCSTVGYGNISPTTTLGRMIMIVYSVIGIPVNGILFAGLGEYFGRTFKSIYSRYKKYKMSTDIHYVPAQLGLMATVIIALIPGITIFLLVPSFIFSYFEGWPYSLSFYYSYVTTSTIGFGDYVPTFQPDQPRKFGGWFVAYEIFIIVWFIFSLGYLVMIMTFVTRGLTSKKLKRLEQQLSANIKATQNRIWNGVAKDVGYLRRILNELYILKVKPVYSEPPALLHRSISCPDLTMYRVDPVPVPRRKRAFSECYDAFDANGTPVHAASDTELDKLDKQKSFETAEAYRQTTDLLAKVVSALATVKPTPAEDDASLYGGYHGFSDSQILASEWSFSTVQEPPPRRGRACSDFNLAPKLPIKRPIGSPNEWTWSGDNDQIQEAINTRYRQRDTNNLYRSSFGQPPLDYIINMNGNAAAGEGEDLRKSRSKKFSMPEGLRKLFPFKKRGEVLDTAAATANGRKFSVVSVPEVQLQQKPPLDYYSTVTAAGSPSYFRNNNLSSVPLQGNQNLAFASSDASISSRLSSATVTGATGFRGIRQTNYDPEQATLNQANNAAYLRKSVVGQKKRRESIFTPNPALNSRRGSVFPTSSNTASGLTQRRNSLFNNERRGSSTITSAGLPQQRRGSMFPTLTENADMDVLETTTLADLIRALEVVHTQAVLDEQATQSQQATINSGAMSGIFRSDKKKRKLGTAGIVVPEAPPILSLFDRTDNRTMTAAAANRLYARRSTIVGTLPQQSFTPSSTNARATNTAMLMKRKPSVMQIVEAPPSYTERDSKGSAASSSTTTVHSGSSSAAPPPSKMNKFKRRFSIRPTALQIPPGQAPPPGVSINSVLQQQQSGISPPSTPALSSGGGSISPTASQSKLQRRLSLRPSPLAREVSTDSNMPNSPTSPAASTSSTARLLPSVPPRPSSLSTSTHSPLSRIAQISQAKRKSSMQQDGANMPQNQNK